MPTTNNRAPNRLIHETSPYLLQHAYNPVDWYPWGNEAFAKAKADDKPVFLSVGYSTCHWCHVMEEESFVDTQAADYLNSHFVSVKVDKEERPDIDAVYMTVCQALTGSGGWPTTILMTHEQKPFFAGTYFPKRSRYGHIGLLELLSAVKQKWDSDRISLIESGDKISQSLARSPVKRKSANIPDENAIEKSAAELGISFDKQYGGFGSAPKFPMPHNLMFLLRRHSLGETEVALDMAEHTLTQMYKGGIFDHIGGGFSRYSTDKKWLAPHFEKMLYDNALLTVAYLECYEITKDTLYKSVAEKTLSYVDREMTSDAGGFYSAQDADSDGEEGKYYTFTQREIIEVLGKDDGETFCQRYDVTESGNFEGKSILNLIAQDTGLMPGEQTQRDLDRLYSYRKDRFKLHKDDKILTSWNALMIAALAKAYRVLGDTKYLESATNAADFISENLTDSGGNLYISWRDGKAKGSGVLDDYAFLAWAYLELYDADFKLCYLEKAAALAKKILTDFSDEAGGFYLNANSGEQLLFRTKEQFDGALPAGNSVAAYVLVRLAALTAEKDWISAADEQLAFYADIFARQPASCTFALLALMYKTYPARELVCVLGNGADREFAVSELRKIRLLQTSVLLKTPDESGQLAMLAPFSVAYTVPEDKRLALYLCEGGACSAPVYSFDELKKML